MIFSRSTPKFLLILVTFHIVAGIAVASVFYALSGIVSARTLSIICYAVLVPVAAGYYFSLRFFLARPHWYGRDIERR